MALIGVLRWREETNVLSSVTGAKRDSYWRRGVDGAGGVTCGDLDRISPILHIPITGLALFFKVISPIGLQLNDSLIF